MRFGESGTRSIWLVPGHDRQVSVGDPLSTIGQRTMAAATAAEAKATPEFVTIK
ncbi:hypothetical protein [Agromyces bauzanensis]|uniref:hypothetical protein n=1 Tax=Agromyces bauzanensis TaxID=1308924 RepID=UPI00166EC100|nr:hypothetical protein [Agromyces bauzanensis]